MKKSVLRRLIAFCVISLFIEMGSAAVDIVFSTVADPVWYYIENQGTDSRGGKLIASTTESNGSKTNVLRGVSPSISEASMWRIEGNANGAVLVNKLNGKAISIAPDYSTDQYLYTNDTPGSVWFIRESNPVTKPGVYYMYNENPPGNNNYQIHMTTSFYYMGTWKGETTTMSGWKFYKANEKSLQLLKAQLDNAIKCRNTASGAPYTNKDGILVVAVRGNNLDSAITNAQTLVAGTPTIDQIIVASKELSAAVVEVPYKHSMVIDFEDPDNFVEGEDITPGYGSYTAGITDNIWAEPDWGGGGEPADPINQSAYCLQVDVSGRDPWEGPNLVFPTPVTISALDSSTWFFHVQMLLPEFQAKGGTFAMNIFDAPNMGARKYIYDSNITTGQIKYPADYNATDRPNQCWVELDLDMRPYFGVTFYSIQIQGERGTGAATWYCDNICFDNRQKNFKNFESGEVQTLNVGDNGAQFLIFYAGTSYCMTAQDTPPTGFAQSAFTKFDPEKYADNSQTNFQVWNVKKSTVATDKPYYTIDYDYAYLYNNGSTRGLDETDAKFSWFLTKKPGDAGLRVLNASTCEYIAPSVVMEDLELGASKDSSSQWVFVPNNTDAVDAYLATTAEGDAKVKVQVPNGDYYIFYAGTNYCMTDTRPMVWQKAIRTLQDSVTTQTDSIYIPGISYNSPTITDTKALYPLVLNEFAATENQQWRVQYYSDFLDQDQTHTFWKRIIKDGIVAKDESGFYPLVTERMHWGYDDSVRRDVGTRLITSKPYTVNWIDRYGEPQVLENYISIFGDNATIINDDNNQQWFVKHIPVNKDGIAAIYRPNNGIQGTALKAKYAGGALYATPNDQSGNESEKNYYCWNFVKLDDPRMASVEASQALIVKDTVFGYPKPVTPGQYCIQYRGTNQVLTYIPKVVDDPDTEIIEKEVPAAAVVSPLGSNIMSRYKSQRWIVADAGNGLFTVSTPDGKQLYTPKSVGKALLLDEDEAASASFEDKYKQLEGLYMGTTDMGQYGAWLLNVDPKACKFFDIQSQVTGAALTTTTSPSDYPFVFIPFSMNQVVSGDPLPDTTLVQEGYYYIQYAFAADSFDVTKPYVLSQAEDISTLKTPTILTPYDPSNPSQKWYIAPIAYDTAQLANPAVDVTKFCNYSIFAASTVKDSLDAGMSIMDIFRNPDYNTIGYRLLDDNGTTNIEDVGVNYSWFSFKLYDKGGKIALRNAKGSGFQSYTADHIASTVGGVVEASNYGDASSANFNEPRSFCWYLIPAIETPYFKSVSSYAPWNPLNGADSIPSYKSGDVNMDGEVSILDAVLVVDCILGKSPQPFNANIADINKDGSISVLDAVQIVDILMGRSDSRSIASTEIATSDCMEIVPIKIQAGETKKLVLRLNNTNAYTAFQMDLTLPTGFSIVKDSEGGNEIAFADSRNSASHVISSNRMNDGKVRIVSYSPGNTLYKGIPGDFLTITIKADESITDGAKSVTVDNMHLITDTRYDNQLRACSEMAVVNGMTGLEENLMEGLSISVERDRLLIRSSDKLELPLYGVDGRLIRILQIQTGSNVFTLEKGVYIVNSSKVVIL